MSDINGLLQEINEELQHQKTMDFWKKWGPTILAVALVIVLGTAAGTGWKSYRVKAQQRATSELLTVLMQPGENAAQKTEALNSFIEKEPDTAQAVLARFESASTFIGESKTDKALEIYDALAKDQAVEPIFRQLADFFAVQAQLDSGDPATLIARLEPLFADSAWRFSAKEYAAHLALKRGDKEKAMRLFTELNQDKATPPTLQVRVRDMLRWMEGGA